MSEAKKSRKNNTLQNLNNQAFKVYRGFIEKSKLVLAKCSISKDANLEDENKYLGHLHDETINFNDIDKLTNENLWKNYRKLGCQKFNLTDCETIPANPYAAPAVQKPQEIRNYCRRLVSTANQYSVIVYVPEAHFDEFLRRLSTVCNSYTYNELNKPELKRKFSTTVVSCELELTDDIKSLILKKYAVRYIFLFSKFGQKSIDNLQKFDTDSDNKYANYKNLTFLNDDETKIVETLVNNQKSGIGTHVGISLNTASANIKDLNLFLLNLHYDCLVKWYGETMSVVEEHIPALEKALEKNRKSGAFLKRSECIELGKKIFSSQQDQTIDIENAFIDFVHALQEYIPMYMERKKYVNGKLNEATLEAHLMSMLEEVPNGVAAEVGINRNSLPLDIFVISNEISLNIKLKIPESRDSIECAGEQSLKYMKLMQSRCRFVGFIALKPHPNNYKNVQAIYCPCACGKQENYVGLILGFSNCVSLSGSEHLFRRSNEDDIAKVLSEYDEDERKIVEKTL